MNKTILAATVALSTALSAHAADPASSVRFLAGAGLTFGGDTLVTVQFNNGSSEDINGGGLVVLHGGLEARVSTAVSLQATIGYHVDNSSASNGSVRFSRVPVDLLAYYHVNDQVRLGGGVQYVSNPELKGSGAASNVNVKFDNATGAVLEAEYLFNPKMGAKLRVVSEEFQPQGGGPKADGSHIGLMFNYYF